MATENRRMIRRLLEDIHILILIILMIHSRAFAENSLFSTKEELGLDVAGRSFGPFSTVLRDSSFSVNLTWSINTGVLQEEEEIELQVTTSGRGVNWVGFGFTHQNKFENADWFVVWRSKKGRLYHKDCNSMKGVLHFDVNQDYDLIHREGLHDFTVRRELDTGDDFDVKLEDGKVNVIWAYGKANSFSRIKKEIQNQWKSESIFLYDQSKEKGMHVTDLPKTILRKVDKNELPRVDLDQGIKQASNDKSLKDQRTVTVNSVNGDTKRGKNQSSVTMTTADFGQGARSQNKEKTIMTNCTVVVDNKRSWYEVLKLKEKSVYYAIIGSSAIITGMIVILLICCCTSASSSSSRLKSKVAFYKVDDYDDEQVEFLKQRT